MRYLLVVVFIFILSSLATAQDFKKGMQAYQRDDYAAAMAEWRPLAEQGSTEAQFALAQMYNIGLGVPQSDTEAFTWFRRAGEGGHDDAEIILGFFYANGVGIRADPFQAYYWFSVAARRGNSVAVANRRNLAPLLSAAQRSEADQLVEAQLGKVKIPSRRSNSTPTTASPTDQPDGFRIQLGAFTSAEQVPALWQGLRIEQTDILGNLRHRIQRVERDEGVFYVLQAGPVASFETAKALCAELTSRNIDCIVVNP